ncbi:MAG: flavodoxin family protein [Bacteroidota bacterium]
MKTLVLFYSFSGTTRRWAEAIARTLGADLEEIRTVVPLETKEDLERMQREGKPFSVLPPEKDPKDYDRIVLGSPVWAFGLAFPFRTFLKEHRFQGKQVAFFLSFQAFPGLAGFALKRLLKGNTLMGRRSFKQKETTESQVSAWAETLKR